MTDVAPVAREIFQEEPIRMVVVRNVRMLARRDGLTDGAVGQALGHGRSWAWRRFSGELPFDLDDVERLALLFRVDPAHLLAPAHTWTPRTAGRVAS